jgi:hypothetical protein
MASTLTPERPRPSVFATFLVLSLIVHLAVLAWLNRAELSLGEAEPPPIVVKLAPETAAPAPPAAAPRAAPPGAARAAPPKQQIVAPSDQENELPPTAPAFLSDRDNRVEKESVKKGNPDAGASEPPPPKPAEAVASAKAPPPPAPQKAAPGPEARPAPPRAEAKAPPAQRPARPVGRPIERVQELPGDTEPAGKPLPGLDQLLAPPSEVLAKADTGGRPSGGAAAATAPADDPRRDLVSAPPPAPRGIFGGPRGTFDDLPDVAQGNLTLLNTKADRFAPFVRRVGTRVFQNLLIFQRRNLGLSDILAAHEPITVRAILDKGGKLKTLDIEDRSGSHAVDQTLLDALRQAAFDQNPPQSAANANGEYEFIFQAQLAAAIAPGPGQPQVQAIESRLRVGLL